MPESSKKTPREARPWVELVNKEGSDSQLFINRDDDLIQEMAKSLGQKLTLRVDSEGHVVCLEGDPVDVSKAYLECMTRVMEMTEFLESLNKKSK